MTTRWLSKVRERARRMSVVTDEELTNYLNEAVRIIASDACDEWGRAFERYTRESSVQGGQRAGDSAKRAGTLEAP